MAHNLSGGAHLDIPSERVTVSAQTFSDCGCCQVSRYDFEFLLFESMIIPYPEIILIIYVSL